VHDRGSQKHRVVGALGKVLPGSKELLKLQREFAESERLISGIPQNETPATSNGRVLTDFAFIQMDEDRWYPDMWMDACK
jgi:hypothetical protein